MIQKIATLMLLLIPAVSLAIDKITVVGLFSDKAVIKVDGKQHVLSVGQTSPEGVKLISSNSREAVLEIDGEQKTYGLGTHISSNYEKPAAGKIVTVAPDGMGMYEVNGSINGFQVDFVIDTGATLVSMNKHHAKRIGLNYKLEGKESLSQTAAGYSKIYIVNLKKVRIGDIEIADVEGAVHDDDFPKVILLGNSFLNRLKLNREGALLLLEK